MSDDLVIIQLDVPDFILETSNEDFRTSKLSTDEFNKIIRLLIWETHLNNSYLMGSIQKTNGDFLIKTFIHKNFQNELIGIYQELKNRINNNLLDDFKVNENLVITSEDFKKTKDLILNILIANNISIIKLILRDKLRLSRKIDNKNEYTEGLDMAIASVTKSLNNYDVNSNNTLMAYCEKDIIGSIKTTQKKDDLISTSDELKKIHYFLKKFVENKDEYIYYSSKELLLLLLGGIKTLDKKDVILFGKSYFYLLGFGKVTVNNFCKKYGITEDTDIPSFFRNDNNVDIFIENILEYIQETKKKKKDDDMDFLPKRILTITDSLQVLENGGVASLDKKVGEDNDTTLLESLGSDNKMTHLETIILQRDNKTIWDREIKHIKERNDKVEYVKPNVEWNSLEKIIAATCINEYLTFKEFRDMIIEYGKEKGVGDKYVKNFHLYLSLFRFKDKTNRYQYDNRVMDALIFEQMGDILGFSKQYAMKVYKQLKEKFDTNPAYKDLLHFVKYDTEYHGKTKTFRNLKDRIKPENEMTEDEKLENTKQEYVPDKNLDDSYKNKRIV